VPLGAESEQVTLHVTASTVAHDFTRLSKATTAAKYQSMITSTGLHQELNAFDRD
jgi:hypothetical protein